MGQSRPWVVIYFTESIFKVHKTIHSCLETLHKLLQLTCYDTKTCNKADCPGRWPIGARFPMAYQNKPLWVYIKPKLYQILGASLLDYHGQCLRVDKVMLSVMGEALSAHPWDEDGPFDQIRLSFMWADNVRPRGSLSELAIAVWYWNVEAKSVHSLTSQEQFHSESPPSNINLSPLHGVHCTFSWYSQLWYNYRLLLWDWITTWQIDHIATMYVEHLQKQYYIHIHVH